MTNNSNEKHEKWSKGDIIFCAVQACLFSGVAVLYIMLAVFQMHDISSIALAVRVFVAVAFIVFAVANIGSIAKHVKELSQE